MVKKVTETQGPEYRKPHLALVGNKSKLQESSDLFRDQDKCFTRWSFIQAHSVNCPQSKVCCINRVATKYLPPVILFYLLLHNRYTLAMHISLLVTNLCRSSVA